jgi:hypothetical protein
MDLFPNVFLSTISSRFNKHFYTAIPDNADMLPTFVAMSAIPKRQGLARGASSVQPPFVQPKLLLAAAGFWRTATLRPAT